MTEFSDMRATGDALQSEGSRLAEWVLERQRVHSDVPYEVVQAALEVSIRAEEWTSIRRGSARA